jgi:lipid-binding SYLF domain-containing protein
MVIHPSTEVNTMNPVLVVKPLFPDALGAEARRVLTSAPVRWSAMVSGGLLVLAALLQPACARAAEDADAMALVDKARSTVETFAQDPEMAAMKTGLRQAKAVLVFPQVLRAGFFIGGSGGHGVLLVRDERAGAWTGPAFYTLGAASLGLQAGATAAEVVMLVNSQKTLDSLLANQIKVGAEATAVLGPKGAGAATAMNTDFTVYAKVKGLFAGVSVDGALLNVREGLNAAYYGKPASPTDILVNKTVNRPEAKALLDALVAAAP